MAVISSQHDAATPEPSRVDSVYGWLVEAITGLELPAGTPLLENALARQLGVSRTPVREALQRLEREGLVQRSPNSRFVVAVLSERDVHEACDALEVLDVYLFQRAARRLTPAQGDTLAACVEIMRTAAKAHDPRAWAEADREFHATLAAAADNRMVADLVQQVRRRVQRFWLTQAVRSERLEGCSLEHAELADAVRAGDLDAIPPLVAAHIAHQRESLLTMLDAAAPLLGGQTRPPSRDGQDSA